MKPRAIDVKILNEYNIEITFDNGEKRVKLFKFEHFSSQFGTKNAYSF